MSAAESTDPRLAQWISEAQQLGATHARAAASWITDGNESDASRRIKLRVIEDDGADEVIRRPNLSGEYADDLTPFGLVALITGLDPRAGEISDEIMPPLCDAYEQGVSDTFEDACVAELTRWLS